MRPFRGDQRRNRTVSITFVPRLQIHQKVFHISRKTLVYQLLVAPLRARLDAGREEHLQLGMREDHRAHVAPVGHQARRLAKAQLQTDQGLAHRWQYGNFRRRIAHFFGTDLLGDVFLGQQDFAARKVALQMFGQLGQRVLVAQVRAAAQRAQGRQAVQRARIEVMKAQLVGHAVRHRALAGSGGAVDGDDWDVGGRHYFVSKKLNPKSEPGSDPEGLTPDFVWGYWLNQSVLGNPRERGKILGEGLGHAFRVVDAHFIAAARGAIE